MTFFLTILYKVLTGSLSIYVYIPKNGLNCYNSACSHIFKKSLVHLPDILFHKSFQSPVNCQNVLNCYI